nr:MAG TPA: hypothetical protein [Microviridae sp.]
MLLAFCPCSCVWTRAFVVASGFWHFFGRNEVAQRTN